MSDQFSKTSSVKDLHAVKIGNKIILNFTTTSHGNVVSTATLKPIVTVGMQVTTNAGADVLKLKYGFGDKDGHFTIAVLSSYTSAEASTITNDAYCCCIYDIA